MLNPDAGGAARSAETLPLSLQSVSLEYPDGGARLLALDDVGLDVGRGRLLSLVGPSGSGKSSLLAVAATLIRPTSGRVLIEGSDTAFLSEQDRAALRREKIGIVFQQPNLLPSLTALEQLVIAERLRNRRPGAEERARAMLADVGLGRDAGKRPHQLSGGQRQRVNIARALMGRPSVLLVDEPTAALDHERSDSVVRLLADLTHRFGTATVMVTHDTGFIRLTDEVATMRDGRLAAPVPAGRS